MHPQDTIPEEWRPVVGYESLYSVSNLGQVRREQPCKGTRSGHILRSHPNPGGYHYLSLYRNTQRWAIGVHQVVAAAFLGPCPAGYQINHRNGDKANNAASNLEYVTPSENQYHASRTGLMATGDRQPNHLHPERLPRGEARPNTKLTNIEVIAIRSLHQQGGWTCHQLASRYGRGDTTIRAILTRRTWKHLP